MARGRKRKYPLNEQKDILSRKNEGLFGRLRTLFINCGYNLKDKYIEILSKFLENGNLTGQILDQNFKNSGIKLHKDSLEFLLNKIKEIK